MKKFLCFDCVHARLRLARIPPEMNQGAITPDVVVPWCTAVKGAVISIQLPVVSCEDFAPSALTAEDRLKMLNEFKGKLLPQNNTQGV